MTNSNNTITLPNSLFDTAPIPQFTSDTLAYHLDSMSGINVVSSSAASDTITLSSWGGPGTISNGSYGGGSYSTGTMYHNTSNNSFYVNTGNGNWSSMSSSYFNESEAFQNRFPEWNAFRKLCDEYPGLEKAYQNLKTFYSICYADSLLPKED